ncbi:MAG: hypothetical protein KGP10_07500 [Actinomycetales bacterium]|nr:hypothetical protein [Actinomycetales bacterium]
MPTHATSNEPPQSPILAAIRAREEHLAAAAEAERQAELDAVMGTTRLEPPAGDDQPG